MTLSNAIRWIVLDVEGTTAPIDFVYAELFPYAREAMPRYLRDHWVDADVREAVADLAEARAFESDEAPALADVDGVPTIDGVCAYARWLMERDRKTTPLKTLQGLIWEVGYRRGELVSRVFDDVGPAFERWRGAGVRIASYSSGSIRAQKLLYENTQQGDLARFIDAFFDTTTGAKADPESYRAIARVLEVDPRNALFASDVAAELDAAHEAHYSVVLAVRPGNKPVEDAGRFVRIDTFEALTRI